MMQRGPVPTTPRAERTFYAELFAAAPVLIAVLRVSPAAVIWSSQPFLGYFGDGQGAEKAALLNTLVQFPTAGSSRTIPIRDPSGASNWVVCTTAPFRLGSGGQVTQVVSVLRALTAAQSPPEISASRVRARAQRGRLASLTPRQEEVLVHLSRGKSSAEIADALHLSTHTVEKHRRALKSKLNARNVADLVRMAVEEGLHRQTLPP